MDCFVLPGSILRRWSSGSSLRYRALEAEEGLYEAETGPVTVVVGKERREFLVDPFVLEESPFRALMDAVRKEGKGRAPPGSTKARNKGVIFVDVDAILFEHMLWLLRNDCSSFFELNVEEIIDFYAQES
ncbi:auxin-responsive protein SAUR77-like [Punica granatum]|uniref:Uncharacterized protein n=2 Tax=Punica granatum TaxID=22663 RepID=A0A2I0ITD5_PUNGR|nr:auxin-responsive protein SAUR77-like [Punica granatum]PKI46890.1 hypothetical protein CRG98_032701 [Punica granatum]